MCVHLTMILFACLLASPTCVPCCVYLHEPQLIDSNGVGTGYNDHETDNYQHQTDNYQQQDGGYQNNTGYDDQYNGYNDDTPEWDDNEWDEDPGQPQQQTGPPPSYPTTSTRVESRTSGDSCECGSMYCLNVRTYVCIFNHMYIRTYVWIKMEEYGLSH